MLIIAFPDGGLVTASFLAPVFTMATQLSPFPFINATASTQFDRFSGFSAFRSGSLQLCKTKSANVLCLAWVGLIKRKLFNFKMMMLLLKYYCSISTVAVLLLDLLADLLLLFIVFLPLLVLVCCKYFSPISVLAVGIVIMLRMV